MKSKQLIFCAITIAHATYAQKTCVIADMTTRIPIYNAKVIHDHYESVAVTTNYKGEFIISSNNYRNLTVSAFGYMRRIVAQKEVGDTIFLMPNDNRLDEFTVYGRDPLKHATINIQLQKWKKEAKSMPKPSGIDLLSIFRRGVSEKKKRERLKAIENY